MDSRSWLLLEPDPPELQLPDDLRARDRFGGRDCGWVAQMRPFVRHYAAPGACVFDPFCGFATTLLAAALEGRRGCGLEIDPARAQLARERLLRHGIDAPVAVGSLPRTPAPQPFDLCLTNVPYFGCRWPDAGAPSAPGGQLYLERDYEGYLRRLRDLFHAVRAALPEGGYCIAMAENLNLGGRMLPLAWDLARILGGLFVAREERLLCYAREPRPLAPADPATDRSHEYALVFQKQRERICLDSTCETLQALREAGFAFALHGSFAQWLAEPGARAPADADLLLPDDQPEFDRLLWWLHERGFELTLWGEPLHPPLRLPRLREHWYLRAQRRDRLGRLVRLDLSLAGHADQQPSREAESH